MNAMGHNENAIRLAALAGDAQIALDKVAKGEADAIDGWLAYGAALNEGRALFPGDREFSAWMVEWQLAIPVEPHERAAAMWAAANADQLAEAKAASKARTLRGWHDQWKKIEAEREKAAAEAERKAKAEAERKEREARAEEARKAAADAKAKEEEARKAAKAARDEEERASAEARAQEAAKAKAEAERAAEEAEAEPQEPEPEPAPDPYGYSKLTEGALLDLANGLREAFEEERAKRKKAEAEVKDLKAKLRDLTADDKDEVIRRLQASIKHKSNEAFRESEKFAAEKRKNYGLKKRVEELERMEIPLN